MLKKGLLKNAAGFRHGIVLPPHHVATSASDLEGFFIIGIPQHTEDTWRSAAGGIGRSYEEAESAAIGEALERYAAFACTVPKKEAGELNDQQIIPLESFSLFSEEQRRRDEFPYNDPYQNKNRAYTNVFSVYTNGEHWVPIELVTLSDTHSQIFSTSSGLAAGSSPYQALLRAIQELIERDALMITWLHSIPGRNVPLNSTYTDAVRKKGGSIICIDATPRYSPFPVAIIAGSLPLRGRPRISLGCACRETWEKAVEKAFLEWNQGVLFAGYYYAAHPTITFKRYEDVQTFDDHAVYYTVYPQQWEKTALLTGTIQKKRLYNKNMVSTSTTNALSDAIRHLRREKIRFYYRDLTTLDLRQIGISVMRVVSPDLTPIHFHQDYPFLGGKTNDVYWRYPWAKTYKLRYPNPMPHPLG